MGSAMDVKALTLHSAIGIMTPTSGRAALNHPVLPSHSALL